MGRTSTTAGHSNVAFYIKTERFQSIGYEVRGAHFPVAGFRMCIDVVPEV